PGGDPAALGRYGWTGREYDSNTGLYHSILGRNYNPETGRWNSEDPLGFTGGDSTLYRYLGTNPTRRTDPPRMKVSEPSDADVATQPFSNVYNVCKNLAVTALGKDGLNGFPDSWGAQGVYDGGFSPPHYFWLNNFFNKVPAATLKGIEDFLNKYQAP